MDFETISQECSLCDSTKIAQTVPLHWTRCLPELKIEKAYKTTSPPKWLTDFENFAKMFLWSLSTKIAQTLRHHLILPTISLVQYGSCEQARAIIALLCIELSSVLRPPRFYNTLLLQTVDKRPNYFVIYFNGCKPQLYRYPPYSICLVLYKTNFMP